MSQIPSLIKGSKFYFGTLVRVIQWVWLFRERARQVTSKTDVLGALLIVALLAASVQAQARTVYNGDILYSGEATATTEVEAAFLAEAQAIRGILVECSLAHKDIKVFEKTIERIGEAFNAKVIAGLTFESCEEAKSPNEERRRRLTNPIVVEDQAAYLQYLKSELSTKEKTFDLRGYLNRRFNGIESRLSEIEGRVGELKMSQPQSVKEIVFIERQSSSPPSGSACARNAKRLMRMAEVAALKNKTM